MLSLTEDNDARGVVKTFTAGCILLIALLAAGQGEGAGLGVSLRPETRKHRGH
jgi:hypothetical protein